MLGVLQIVRGSALRKSRDRIVRRGRGCERAAYRQRRRLGYSGIMDTHVALPHPDLSVLCSYLQKDLVARINSRAQSAPAATFYVRRTYTGRPSSSIRFSEATAMATSVICRPPVRERSASPITRL